MTNSTILFAVSSNNSKLLDILKNYSKFHKAIDGVECYEQSRLYHHTIDVIVAELNLEILNAIDVLEKIRSRKSDTPFVLVANDKLSVKQFHRAVQLGISDCIMEPYQPEQVTLAIKQILENKAQLDLSQKRQKDIEALFKILDEHNIVSRTNQYGVINHVNKIFCEFSGYKKDELIGSSHNIVRHPDNPKSLYENLWKTISSGNPWTGTLKNRSKDGSDYTINTLIIPLVSATNEIEGYASSSHIVSMEKATIEKVENMNGLLRKNFIALKSELVRITKNAEVQCNDKVAIEVQKAIKFWKECNENLQESLTSQIKKNKTLAEVLRLREQEVAKSYEKQTDYNRKIKENNLIVEDTKKRSKTEIEKYKKDNDMLIAKNTRLEEEVKQMREQLLGNIKS